MKVQPKAPAPPLPAAAEAVAPRQTQQSAQTPPRQVQPAPPAHLGSSVDLHG